MQLVPVAARRPFVQAKAFRRPGRAVEPDPGARPVDGDARDFGSARTGSPSGRGTERRWGGMPSSNWVASQPEAAFSISRKSSSYSRSSPQADAGQRLHEPCVDDRTTTGIPPLPTPANARAVVHLESCFARSYPPRKARGCIARPKERQGDTTSLNGDVQESKRGGTLAQPRRQEDQVSNVVEVSLGASVRPRTARWAALQACAVFRLSGADAFAASGFGAAARGAATARAAAAAAGDPARAAGTAARARQAERRADARRRRLPGRRRRRRRCAMRCRS